MKTIFKSFAIGCLLFFDYYVSEPQRSNDASSLTDILLSGVSDATYPGAVAMVGNHYGILYRQAVGHFTYSEDSPTVQLDSLFDIASLTKVVSTTSAVALLYQEGLLDINSRVIDTLGDMFASHGKDKITIQNCLLHNAGFSPDPVPWYWSPDFPCPNTDDKYPREDFSCLEPFIRDSFYNESLQSVPGESYVYSDLSFITLQLVVGTIAINNKLVSRAHYRAECSDWLRVHADYAFVDKVCAFEAYTRLHVFQHGTAEGARWMPSTTYLPTEEKWKQCMPTLNDTGDGSYTHRRLQGQVADGDCYAMGGIAGHAGVFSTAGDIGNFLQYMLSMSLRAKKVSSFKWTDEVPLGRRGFLNETTVTLFTALHNSSQSSRALGWSINTPLVADYGYDNSCGTMSDATYMHTGYTGTCCCVDPDTDSPLWTVILTNRIYNCDGQLCPSGSSDAVKTIYKSFNSKAKELFLGAKGMAGN